MAHRGPSRSSTSFPASYRPGELGSLPPSLRHAVQDELRPDESLLWVGTPKPMRAASPTWGMAMFALPWTMFALMWTVMASSAYMLFGIIGWPFLLMGLWLVATPYLAIREARHTVYIITTRRVLSVTEGRSRRVHQWLPDVQALERIERADGSGDLLFLRREHHENDGEFHAERVGFHGVPAVRRVEHIIRAAFSAPMLPTPQR